MIEQTIKELLELPTAKFTKAEPLTLNGKSLLHTTIEYIEGSKISIQRCSKKDKYCMVVFVEDGRVFTGVKYPFGQIKEAKQHATIMSVLIADNPTIEDAAKAHVLSLLILRGYNNCTSLERMYIENIVEKYQKGK